MLVELLPLSPLGAHNGPTITYIFILELKLYISILRLNKKYEEILSYVKVDTESGEYSNISQFPMRTRVTFPPLEIKLADEDERFYLETECLMELLRWEEAVGCYKARCQLV